MVFTKLDTFVLVFAGILLCSIYCEATGHNKELSRAAPEAQERKFTNIKQQKLGHLAGKKNWLTSLLTRSPEPPTVHSLVPLDHYAIWKVHKYKGIELRPVQVVDLPQTFHYDAVEQPEIYNPLPMFQFDNPTLQIASPIVHTLRVPQAQYGVPDVSGYSFNDNSHFRVSQNEEPEKSVSNGDIFAKDQLLAGYVPLAPEFHGQILGSVENLMPAIDFSNSDNSFIGKLKGLKAWNLDLKRQKLNKLFSPITNFGSHSPSTVALPTLPEVEDIPVKGLENVNLQVPEIPQINLPAYSSVQTSGPYLRVNAGNPLPVVNYDANTAASHHNYPSGDYDSTPDSGNDFPPLSNSYGVPYTSDGYYSAPSDQITSYTSQEPQLPSNQAQQVNIHDNSTIMNGTNQRSDVSDLSREGTQSTEQPKSNPGLPEEDPTLIKNQ